MLIYLFNIVIMENKELKEDFGTEGFKPYTIKEVSPVEMFREIELKQAMRVLQKHLREDKSEGSYYYSWQANIAMAFVDNYRWEENKSDYGDIMREVPYEVIHKVANEAAKNFLNLLIKE